MPNGKPTLLSPSRFAPTSRRRLSGPGLRTFLNIAELWGLNEDTQRALLGGPAPTTYRRWCEKAREGVDLTLSAGVLTRISAVLGIHRALCVLFTDEDERSHWLTHRHGASVFGDRPPISLVTSGAVDDLMTVRRFLDAARGGIYRAPNAADVGFEPYQDDEIIIDR